MPPPENFVHLHVHSHFSLLDGACRIPDLLARAAELGMPALALTDHGNLYGIVQFFQAAQGTGVKPILGYEAYVAPGSRRSREAAGPRQAASHLTLLAETDAGYRNLLKLASTAFLDGFYYKPRIDREVLAECSEGLIALSGCLKGEVPGLLLMGAYDEALAAGQRYVDLLGPDHFFIELQNNGLAEQAQVLGPLCDVAAKLGVGTVATSDIHYMDAADARAHDALLCINTGKTLDDVKRMRFATDQFHFPSADEMRERFKKYPDALANTARIAERCNATIDVSTLHFPTFTPPAGRTAEEYLRELAEQGFARKYADPPPEARERLETELDVIHRTGYDTYFLIVWDFVRFCRERNIPAGARGSGCSSLVGYCIGISAVDPIRYNLMFERLLHLERKEMPDFDIDMCERRRGEVIHYVREKYGADSVAQIITFGTLGARAAIRDVGRVMALPLAQVDAIAKKVPTALHITLDEALEQEPELRDLCDNDPQVNELFDIARRVEGLNRHASTHAAGVVIADRPLTEYTALCRPGGEITTQWPMNDIAAVGLLKMDFLGLRTLTIVQSALDLIRETTGEEIDLDAVPLDDDATFALFRAGDTNGVFQFGSSGMRAMLRELGPDKFEELIAANALYRPAALSAGQTEEFIKRKHNPDIITYDHPIIEECLGESYGIMATQEQVMLMVHKLAGISMGRALSLVKAISKKKTSEIEAMREDFLAGAVANDVPRSLAERIFELIVFFGGYGFNRAHSTAYAMLAYKTAYLKAHHPVEFMAATLTCESGNVDTVVRFVDETRKMGIDVLPPSVCRSRSEFTVDGGQVRYGLAAVRGVGEKAAEAIVAAREAHGPFQSFYDFCDTVDLHAVNKQVVETLVKCGAFDGFGVRRAQLALVVEAALRVGAAAQQDRERGQMILFGGADDPEIERAAVAAMPDVPEWPESTLLAREREALGLYISSHPLASHDRLLRAFSTADATAAAEAEDGAPIFIGGIVEALRTSVTRRGPAAGKKMARFTLEDLSGSIACVMFGEDYEHDAGLIQNGRPLFLRGFVSHRTGEPSIRVSDAFEFDQARARFTDSLVLALERDLAGEATFAEIKAVLERNPGKAAVYLEIPDDDRTAVLEAGPELHVAVTDPLLRDLAKLVGGQNVRLNPKPDRAKGARARSMWGNSRNGARRDGANGR